MPTLYFGPRPIRASIIGRLAWVAACLATALMPAGAAYAGTLGALGPNVVIFTPDMPVATIQAAVDAVAAQQLGNQFGAQRTALLFAPGTYGTAATPLNFQVGYYTQVAGLGAAPGDVVINGSVNVYNQCDATGSCVALDNFWRSLSNLTIDVSNASLGCHTGEFWAVSQAAPVRRVQVNGNTTLMDYCSNPSYASGGFIADSVFGGNPVVNGSQQQFFVRNSTIAGWSNGVWNQVFSGVVGAPANCFPAATSCGGPYTTVAKSPVTREAPFLTMNATGAMQVFVPAVQRDTVGPSWQGAHGTPGHAMPIDQFFVASPADSVQTINRALLSGKDLILTPGIYDLAHSIQVLRPDTVILGLGFPTLVPQNGDAALTVYDPLGVSVSGIIIDAGPVRSQALVRIGDAALAGAFDGGSPADPGGLYDVFFRVGGAEKGSAGTALVVDADHVILDDVWAWRADHGVPGSVGWTVNTADTGLVVNGDDVTAYGLFVEHFQQSEVIWRGRRGLDVFFQNEMPYDPPSQAAWMQSPKVLGYPAMAVAPSALGFQGYGLGSYSFFNQGVPIVSSRAFQVAIPLAAGSLQHLLTVFLNVSASGGTAHVVNAVGGPSNAADADTPVTVTSFP